MVTERDYYLYDDVTKALDKAVPSWQSALENRSGVTHPDVLTHYDWALRTARKEMRAVLRVLSAHTLWEIRVAWFVAGGAFGALGIAVFGPK